jgi:hypothetical protein
VVDGENPQLGCNLNGRIDCKVRPETGVPWNSACLGSFGIRTVGISYSPSRGIRLVRCSACSGGDPERGGQAPRCDLSDHRIYLDSNRLPDHARLARRRGVKRPAKPMRFWCKAVARSFPRDAAVTADCRLGIRQGVRETLQVHADSGGGATAYH